MNEFDTRQEVLRERIARDGVKYVFVHPDGTEPSWIGVVVDCSNGVVYGTQCAGTSCDLRFIEGFYIPLGGLKMNADDGPIDSVDLTSVFHQGSRCFYGGTVGDLPPDRLKRLRDAVAEIPCWETRPDQQDGDRRVPLQLDDSRLNEVCEAWVPVVTAMGSGVLLWKNCD